ncbi:MAG: MarR family transcriptional regulator [Pseudomonadota bacterium]
MKSEDAPAAAALPSTARSLPIVLMRARESVMAPIREMLSESGVTEQQWRLLRVLAEYGPQDASRLAERASIILSSLTRISRSMIEKGYIRRVIDDEDRRRYTVSIAPEGQRILDENLPRALAIAAAYRAKLGDRDYEALLDLLERLDETRAADDGDGR